MNENFHKEFSCMTKEEYLTLCEIEQTECNSDNEQWEEPHNLFPISFGKIRIWAMMIPCALWQ